MEEEPKERELKLRQQRINSEWRIVTQNVRGFEKSSRIQWMGSWRRAPVKERPDIWVLQETHVDTQEEVDELEATWRRVWGKHNSERCPQLTYWSVDASKTGGVAILLNPNIAEHVQPWHPEKWTKRVLAVLWRGVQLVNVYAPNDHSNRETFYESLRQWPWFQGAKVIAGDFNCVQSPALDRLNGQRTGRPESNQLQQLQQELQLEDAWNLMGVADEDGEMVEPTAYYTYWGPEVASRLDRFLVPARWTAKVQWVLVTAPKVPSDHQQVCLHLRKDVTITSNARKRRGVIYPIPSSRPDQVQAALLNDLVDTGVGQSENTRTWDAAAAKCVESIRRIRLQEAIRRRRYRRRTKRQCRALMLTRPELFAAVAEETRQEYLIRLGQRLERTTDQLRWQFKRVSNWERDQSVTEIRQIHGTAFSRELTIAGKFASEWKTVLGVIHNNLSGSGLESEFDAFVDIPNDRKLDAADNRILMEPINEDEVIRAVAGLNRHKAAGPDGLNNDYFKDMQAVLVPAMVNIGNELLRGAEPPESFLEGLIIPLRKKGDSSDAMDFRPISLLQTGYKIFMKVIASRAQHVMGTPVGESQQGFIHGRHIQKTVMMMLGILATAKADPHRTAAMSQIVLLLDFRKAYDTVAREFLFLVLQRFGFSLDFIEMIRKLHDGTTARFLVNGELSDPLEVISGIRQGCPLAPLLFIVATEVLALAIQHNKDIRGITVPGGDGGAHKFSAFVDDSTVFLAEARQLPMVMTIVRQFGRISGLRVQPTKSKVIFLNRAVHLDEFHGIPVLKEGDTVRYLGYEVGTGELSTVNWAARIRAVQRRLATATQLATSLEHRVTILNVIALPSILYTALVFDVPKWAEKQLYNLQKHFLWGHSTRTDAARHKVNPDLLFTPRQAGGIGLVSIPIACKRQRVKTALLWLIQRQDAYFQAWRAWSFRGDSLGRKYVVSPHVEISAQSRQRNIPGKVLQGLVGAWLQPRLQPPTVAVNRYREQLAQAVVQAHSWSTDNTWTVVLSGPLPQSCNQENENLRAFWPTFQWRDNPWITDQTGRMLTIEKYMKIKDCTLEELCIQRQGERTFTMTIPRRGDQPHRQPKLRRWGLAVLSCIPRLQVGETLRVTPEVRIRHPPALEHNYQWTSTGDGRITGVRARPLPGETATIELVQSANGINWTVAKPGLERGEPADAYKLRKHQEEGNIAFFAHPYLHRFPWVVQDGVANKHIGAAIKKQVTRTYSKSTLQAIVQRLEANAQRSQWQAAALAQTPKQVWANNNALTPYQVWVAYRVAVRQLNLFHEGRHLDNSCRRLPICAGTKESMEHLFWECPCARSCWMQLVSHWTGTRVREPQLEAYMQSCASRVAPEITKQRMDEIIVENPDEVNEYVEQWKRMWRVLASICQERLWMQRNQVIFEGKTITKEESRDTFWAIGMRQLQAIAKRERRSPERITQGTRLLFCQQAIAQPPREQSQVGTSPVQPPGRKEPALIARLKTYQTSRHR